MKISIFYKTFIFLLIVQICILILNNNVYANTKYASLTLDAKSGDIIHNNNGFAKRYPASLTKVMTLYLIFEDLESKRLQKSDLITFSENASRKPASKLGLLPGKSINVSNAIKALAVKSANDVATAVAEHIAGSERQFALRMTNKAKELGMYHTTFKNASGLHNDSQTTTAYDMAILGLRILSDFPIESKVFSMKEFQYEGKKYTSHNKLLFTYRGTKGIKTGYTSRSGFNLLTYASRDNKKAISVVMGGSSSASRNSNMVKVLDKSFKVMGEYIAYPIAKPFKEALSKTNFINDDSLLIKDDNISNYDRLHRKANRLIRLLP